MTVMASSSSTVVLGEHDLCQRWTALSDDELTTDAVEQFLFPIPDDLWVTTACTDRLLEDTSVQMKLLELGLSRTESAVHRSRTVYNSEDFDDDEGTQTQEQRKRGALISHFRDEPADAQLCCMRAILLHRLDRLNTFVEMCQESLPPSEDTEIDGMSEWADDPWGDATQDIPSALSRSSLPFTLPEFLTIELLDIACLLASLGLHVAVALLIRRHGLQLWPHRLSILENIPEQVPVSDYRDLLPKFDPNLGEEEHPTLVPWRSEDDWTEQDVTRDIITISGVPLLFELPQAGGHLNPQTSPLSEEALIEWYQTRVRDIIRNGALDSALSLIQHAASQGLPELGEVAEDLHLLSRLVYDIPHTDKEALLSEWSLEWWKSLSPAAVIGEFLRHATRDNVAKFIQKVVNPYLFVLESREERRGNPDPSISTRLLYDYILQAPLDIIAGIFEASKPTLPPAQRLLRNDEDMARLALACLYGSDRLDEWPTMSQIFECLPAWNIQGDGEEAEEADTTIASLAAYVVPSTSQPHVTPSDIYVFFRPLPLTALSRTLDFLDVHLESGEIFSRWSVAAPLRWFLQSHDNISEQRAWATRMARRAGGSEDHLESQEDWEWLLEDMLKLSGAGDSGLKGAFCLLDRDEILRIFLSGLLSAGRGYRSLHALERCSR